MSRYYETKRQQYLDNLPDRRNKAEKTALQQIDANFMSGKEDGEGSQENVWVVRSPLWRSPQLSSLLKRLQEKIDNQPSASWSSLPQNTRRSRRRAIHMWPHQLPHLHGHSFLVVDRALRGLLLKIWLLPPHSPHNIAVVIKAMGNPCICWTLALSQSEGGQTDSYSHCGTKLMPKCSLFT